MSAIFYVLFVSNMCERMVEISEELKELIEGNALALATVNENGKPHCIAVAFVKVVSSDKLLITDNYMVETVRNLKRNPNVSIAVWNKNWEENCVGYELRGSAEYFTSGKYYEMVKSMPENRGEPCKGVIVVTINKIEKLA